MATAATTLDTDSSGPASELRRFSGKPYRLSLEQYERMVDVGLFGDRDKVHLIDGMLVAKMTENDRHATADDLCGAELGRSMPIGWYVRAGKPIRLPSENSKPEPDRSVVKGQIRDYTRRTPEPADIALVVEVADTSLALDRQQASLYGKAGIASYWIINVKDGQVEVYSEPGPEGYQKQAVLVPGDRVPVVIDGVSVAEIAVVDLLP